MQDFWKKLNKSIMAIAPMSGVTDQPFREMALKYGRPDVFWTEFVSADGLFSSSSVIFWSKELLIDKCGYALYNLNAKKE